MEYDKGINKGIPLPMPVCCNSCGKWFTNAKQAVAHAYKECATTKEAKINMEVR